MPDASLPPTLIDLPAELCGPRIVLRPYVAADADAVFAAIDESRAHLAPWMGWADHHRSVADSRDYCLRSAARWILRADLTLGIFAADGTYLGGTGFHDPDWEHRRFEIGYWVRAAAVGHGYATEAVGLLVDLAFGQLGAQRLFLRCDARNAASRRVAQKNGFVLEGQLRNDHVVPDGTLSDDLVFALVPSDLALIGR